MNRLTATGAAIVALSLSTGGPVSSGDNVIVDPVIMPDGTDGGETPSRPVIDKRIERSTPTFVPPVDGLNVLGNRARGAAGTDDDFSGQVSPAGTARITGALAAISAFCGSIAVEEYRIDCLGDQLQQLADTLPDEGDYAETQDAIEQASRGIEAVARKYRSRAINTARVTEGGGGPRASSRPLIAVRPEALDAAAAEAIAVIDEAQTILLRSAASSERRRVHFQAVSAALDSNKVLLRST